MNEFLATLAHELRNPMAPIRTGLEVIRVAANDTKTVEQTRQMMERQAHQLIRLIDDLLDLSRIRLGKLNLKKARIQLTEVLESAVDAIRPFIIEAGHQLHLDVTNQSIVLDGDPNRLTQVFANILSNAVKYTKNNGEIWLTARQEGDEAVVSIRDNGLGIPIAMQQQIFDMFTQIDRPIELGYTGLGIGLTLVKRIVEMHAAWYRSTAQAVTKVASSPSEFLWPRRQKWKRKKDSESGKDEGNRHRVLIVDDNKDSASLLAIILKVLGTTSNWPMTEWRPLKLPNSSCLLLS